MGRKEENKIMITKADGSDYIQGLSLNREYIIKEIKADGYYLSDNIKFVIKNDNGNYKVEIIDGDIKNTRIEELNQIPTVEIDIEDKIIPRFNLEIIKKEANTEKVLKGAVFGIYKNGNKIANCITDDDGKILIPNLYVSEKNYETRYKLKEIEPPMGYSKIKDIEFEVNYNSGELNFIQYTDSMLKYSIEENNILLEIEDNPTFILTKKDGVTNELLPNTKFAIYDIDDNLNFARNNKGEYIGEKEIINGEEYYVLTTDSNGQIKAGIPDGSYKIVEIQTADEKYNIDNIEHFINLGVRDRIKTQISINNVRFITNQSKVQSSGDQAYFYNVVQSPNGDYYCYGYKNEEYIFENNEEMDFSFKNFIIKYNSDFELLWIKKWDKTIKNIISCKDNGLIIYGNFSGTINFDENHSTISEGGWDAYIVKYNGNGNIDWYKTFGGEKDDGIYEGIVTSEGNYIFGGYYKSENILFENYNLRNEGTKNSLYGTSDAYIFSIDERGNILWLKNIEGEVTDYVYSIIEADNGCIALLTSDSKELKIQETIYTNKGKEDIFVIKYSEKGDIEWITNVAGKNADNVKGVIKSDNNYIVYGSFYDEVLIDNESLKSQGGNDVFTILLDLSGEKIWSKSFGGSASEDIYDVANTKDEAFIIAVDSSSSDFLVNGENKKGIVTIKIDYSGEIHWASQFYRDKNTSVEKIYVSQDNECILIMEGNEKYIEGSHTYGADDLFIISYTANGLLNNKYQIGEKGVESYCNFISIGNDKYILLGSTSSSKLVVAGKSYNRSRYSIWKIMPIFLGY